MLITLQVKLVNYVASLERAALAARTPGRHPDALAILWSGNRPRVPGSGPLNRLSSSTRTTTSLPRTGRLGIIARPKVIEGIFDALPSNELHESIEYGGPPAQAFVSISTTFRGDISAASYPRWRKWRELQHPGAPGREVMER